MINEFMNTWPNELSITRNRRTGVNGYGWSDTISFRLRIRSRVCTRCGATENVTTETNQLPCSMDKLKGRHNWNDGWTTTAIGTGETRDEAWEDLVTTFARWEQP